MIDDDDRGGDDGGGAERSRRQVRSAERRQAGDQSARLASALMKLSPEAVAKVIVDEDLRASVAAAQRITSHAARRRAERTLAGELRRHDLDEIEERLAAVKKTGTADQQLFHVTERWRDRLVAGEAQIADLPCPTDDELPRLIDAARRERDTGKPPGAGRKLFRYLADALRMPPANNPE